MKRISTNLPSMDMSYFMRLREYQMNEVQNKIAGQTRIRNLRDDPVGASHAVRFQSKITRLDRFAANIGAARDEMALAEGNLRSAVDVLQRVRELAVQGANGVYSQEQMSYMAEETNQLLSELLEVANAKDGLGNHLFAGNRSQVAPFRATVGRVEGSQEREVVSAVDYVGDIGRNQVEISENASMEYRLPGNYAFWAERQQIFSTVNAMNYRVPRNSTIRIDGVDIQLKEGDNVYAVIAGINSSGAPVRARLDPVRDSLVLESTFAHEIWPEDVGGGSVLQDLGIISPGNASPPLNYADSARVFGGSVFDMVIHLRNSLYKGDSESVGGSALRGIDEAISTLSATLAEIGAKDARLGITESRIAYEKPEYTKFYSQEADVDVTQAATELKMLEYTHKAAVATAARILRPTLLDFLR